MVKQLISIIVPLYNYEKYIGDCMRSIYNQDYDNYELIIVDDCSTDDSLKVCNSLKNRNTQLISFKTNRGYSFAKNEGIVASKGEYIVHLDADDMLTKDSLTYRIKAMEESKVPFVHGKAFHIKESTSLKEAYAGKKLIKKTNEPKIHAQGVMLKKDIYRQYGLYDENLRSRADKEMWWRLFGMTKKDNAFVEKIKLDGYVAYYRVHKNSMMNTRLRNKKLNQEITDKLYRAYEIRRTEGINSENTRLL